MTNSMIDQEKHFNYCLENTKFFLSTLHSRSDSIFILFSNYYATGEGSTISIVIGHSTVADIPMPELVSLSKEDMETFSSAYEEYKCNRNLLKPENRHFLYKNLCELMRDKFKNPYFAMYPDFVMNLSYFMIQDSEEGIEAKNYVSRFLPPQVINMAKACDFGNLIYSSQFHVNYS